MPLTIPQLVADAAERFRDACFLAYGAERRSFADTAKNVAGKAATLLSYGVRKGDRILLSAGNGIDMIEAWLASIHAGGICAAVSPALTEYEIRPLIEDLRPRVILAEKATRPAVCAAADATTIPILEIAPPHSSKPGSWIGEGSERAPLPGGDPADVAAIVYTSGTTSRPKGVLVRHLAYVGAGQSMRSWLGLEAVERLWCTLPLSHINAQAYSLMTALAHGYRLTIAEKFHASTFWRDAASLDVTEVNLIGAMLAVLMRQDPERFVPGTLRTIYSAPTLDPERNRAFEERFGVRLVSGFGMSENTFGCIESRTSRIKPSCVGRPREHPQGFLPNALRIVASSGALAAINEPGELQFRNAALTPGYWNAPESTASAFDDGWLKTGDLGFIDGDGDVTLIGRSTERIRRRGENIAPLEIEEVLLLHPGVEQAAVIGIPSPLSEQDVVACVIPRNERPLDEQTLHAWCRERLAPHKRPLRIIFMDAFPMTATMRVAKNILVERVVTEIAGTLFENP